MKKKLIAYHLPLTINSGFTLIELLVVISVMILLAAALTVNLTGQRAARNIKLAENQLVTDIRKVQGYILSARSLPSGQPVQYYILKFDLSKPTQYTIEAMSGGDSSPVLQDIETINLPPNIQIAAVSPGAYAINISRPVNPVSQPAFTDCALAAFSAPFAKIIFNDGCLIPTVPQVDQNNPNDDYNKIFSFLTNVACIQYPPSSYLPEVCSASTDSIMSLTLTDSAKAISRKILINGISGLVCPTQDGLTCLASN